MTRAVTFPFALGQIAVAILAASSPLPACRRQSDVVCFARWLSLRDKDAPPGRGRVILAFLDDAYSIVGLNWAMAPGIQALPSRNWGFIALSRSAYVIAQELNMPVVCEPLFCGPEALADGDSRNDTLPMGLVGTRGLWYYRTHVLLRLAHSLEDGHGIIFSDADAVWIRNPLREWLPPFGSASRHPSPELESLPLERAVLRQLGHSLSSADIVASSGIFPKSLGWRHTICMGLLLLRISPGTRAVLSRAMEAAPHETDAQRFDDQRNVNTALKEWFAVRWHFRDPGRRLPSVGEGRGAAVWQPQLAHADPPRSVSDPSFEPTPASQVPQQSEVRVRVVLLPQETVTRYCGHRLRQGLRQMVKHCITPQKTKKDKMRSLKRNKVLFLNGSDVARVAILREAVLRDPGLFQRKYLDKWNALYPTPG